MLVETKSPGGGVRHRPGCLPAPVPQPVPEFEAQYATFKTLLPSTVEVIEGGIVTTKEQSQAAGTSSGPPMWTW